MLKVPLRLVAGVFVVAVSCSSPVSSTCAATCRGCCQGETCLPGTAATACGAEGNACDVCVSGQLCVGRCVSEPRGGEGPGGGTASSGGGTAGGGAATAGGAPGGGAAGGGSTAGGAPQGNGCSVALESLSNRVGDFSCAALAIDGAGRVHVAALDLSNIAAQTLRLFRRATNGTWTDRIAMPVSFGRPSICSVALAVDANDAVHVAVTDTTASSLVTDYVTDRDGTLRLHNSALTVSYSGLALQVRGSTLHFLGENAGLTWRRGTFQGLYQVTPIRTAAVQGAGRYDFHLLPNDQVRVAFVDQASDQPGYLTNQTGSWVEQPMASGVVVRELPSLALDPSGSAHSVFYDSTGQRLHYASNATGAWTNAPLYADQYIGSGGGVIRIDGQRRLHVLSNFVEQRAPYRSFVVHSIRRGTAWATGVVPVNSSIGEPIAAAVDAADVVHFAAGSRGAGLTYGRVTCP